MVVRITGKLLFHSLLALALLLPAYMVASARPQKSLDEAPASNDKKDKAEKKGGGKSLDEVSPSKGDAPSKKPTGGKSLDAVDTSKKEPPPKFKPPTIDDDRDRPRPPRDRIIVKKPEEPKVEKEPVIQEPDPGPELPEMVTVPAGSFEMGSLAGQTNESPVHTVKISAFEISKFEITNHQFRKFTTEKSYKTVAERDGITKHTWQSYAAPGRGKYPVVVIAYEDALEYCKWLSEKTGQTYRLPTEAEWEYAARAGKNTSYPWGDQIQETNANYAATDRSAYAEPVLDFLKPVGSYQPNAFGIYDVIGNVWEWCGDWYHENYYKDSQPEDPKGPEDGRLRVTRGGGWGNSSVFCSVSFRKPNHPSYKSSSLGFRVVRVLNK